MDQGLVDLDGVSKVVDPCPADLYIGSQSAQDGQEGHVVGSLLEHAAIEVDGCQVVGAHDGKNESTTDIQRTTVNKIELIIRGDGSASVWVDEIDVSCHGDVCVVLDG